MTEPKQPEALRLADWCEKHSSGIYRPSADAADELRRLHARIAELEAQLEAVGAGGVSGPPMGKPQEMPNWMQYDERTDVLTIHGKRYAAGMFGEDGFLSPLGTWLRVCVGSEDCVTLTRATTATSAGGEPVATVFTMEALAPGGGVKYHATVHKPLPAGTKLYLHPSPPEGMVGGWQDIATAPEGQMVVVGWLDHEDTEHPERHDFDMLEDGCWQQWHERAEHVEVIGGHGVSYTPPYTVWMPVSSIPTTSAGSGKGE